MYLASHAFKRFEHVIYNNYNGVIKMPFLMVCCLCSFCEVSCPPWSGFGLASSVVFLSCMIEEGWPLWFFFSSFKWIGQLHHYAHSLPLALGLSRALAELLSFVCLDGLVRLFFSGLSTVASKTCGGPLLARGFFSIFDLRFPAS